MRPCPVTGAQLLFQSTPLANLANFKELKRKLFEILKKATSKNLPFCINRTQSVYSTRVQYFPVKKQFVIYSTESAKHPPGFCDV
jgi:hypothetical protein